MTIAATLSKITNTPGALWLDSKFNLYMYYSEGGKRARKEGWKTKVLGPGDSERHKQMQGALSMTNVMSNPSRKTPG